MDVVLKYLRNVFVNNIINSIKREKDNKKKKKFFCLNFLVKILILQSMFLIYLIKKKENFIIIIIIDFKGINKMILENFFYYKMFFSMWKIKAFKIKISFCLFYLTLY